MTVPLADQIREVERELALRGRVYPFQVKTGKMDQAEADRHMAAMEGVLATLRYVEKNAVGIRRIAARVKGEAG